MKMTLMTRRIAGICLMLSTMLIASCGSDTGTEFTVTYDSGEFVLHQGGQEDQRVRVTDHDNQLSDGYIKLAENPEGLQLVKIAIPDDPDEIPWHAWANSPTLCQAQNDFSFEGLYNEDSIFLPLAHTDSIYGLVYGAAGEEVYFYHQFGKVYTFEPWADLEQGLTATTDTVLYLINCNFFTVVLDGGLSIIIVIDNIEDFQQMQPMQDYCALGSPNDLAKALQRAPNPGQRMASDPPCNPTGESDFAQAPGIKIAAANWCDRVKMDGHCLKIPLPDSTHQYINLITCQAKFTFEGDSIEIRSGCLNNSGNCCQE
jgi:hypothetical protein